METSYGSVIEASQSWEQRIDRTYGYGAIPRPYRLVVVTRGGALSLAAKDGWAPAAF